MLRLTFSEEDVEQLRFERFFHPHPRVQLRMEALLLKSQNLPHKDICRILAISGNTLRQYLKLYQSGGLEALKQFRYRRPKSELEDYADLVEEALFENPPATVAQAAALIEEVTGIKRQPTQVRAFLKRLGFRRLKVGCLPAKADPMAQAEFQKNVMESRLEEAKQGKRTVLFVDAAHFVFGSFLGYLWCVVRRWVQAASGRKRLNVLGALNAVTHQLTTVTNDAYINAKTVCQLLDQLRWQYSTGPLTLFLDNARYQHCNLVKEYAEALQIELVFLPAYSPNLNLIERFWKFVKKQCLYSKHYDNYEGFQSAILDCITNAHRKHQGELKTLLTLNFQSFEEAQLLTV